MKHSTPISLTIFGISGDLASRKLMPALYWLAAAGKLPPNLMIVGASRRNVTVEKLLGSMAKYLGEEPDFRIMRRLESIVRTVQMDGGKPEEYAKLRAVYDELEQGSAAIRLLYLAIPPAAAGVVISAMDESGITKDAYVDTRLLLEKPFGFDLASAKALDTRLTAVFAEKQIYLIDHYLAKETAQNITVFRFANPIMAALWNNRYIDRIEIEASEKMGIQNRVDFYEQTGALRDVVQSHLMSLLALVLMEKPKNDTAKEFHRQRRKVLEAIKPFNASSVARRAWRGQYADYRVEVNNPESITETWAALQLELATRRWKGVPFYLMGGKALDARRTEIRVYFKSTGTEHYDSLTFRLRPNEGIGLQLQAKREGLSSQTAPIWLSFTYGADMPGWRPDGYERVLLDAINGERSGFLTGPEILATWRLVEPVLSAWRRDDQSLKSYTRGSKPPSVKHLTSTSDGK